jgi:hypothetical protein
MASAAVCPNTVQEPSSGTQQTAAFSLSATPPRVELTNLAQAGAHDIVSPGPRIVPRGGCRP